VNTGNVDILQHSFVINIIFFH